MTTEEDNSEWSAEWESTVVLKRSGYGSPVAISYTHTGPVEFKLDGMGHLRLVMTLLDGAEVDIALHLAGTFESVSQEMSPEKTTGTVAPDDNPNLTRGGINVTE